MRIPGTTYPNVHEHIQFEYYDYYAPNYRETGNNAFTAGVWEGATAGNYVNAYNNIMAAELYNIYPRIAVAHNTGFRAYITYLNLVAHGPNFATHGYQNYPPDDIPQG